MKIFSSFRAGNICVDFYPQFHWGLFISGSFRANPIHFEIR
jgi:hypothetical protein